MWWCIVIAWMSWLASIALLWGQHQLGVLHPWSRVFVLLLVITFAATLAGIAIAVRRVIRGPKRFGAAGAGLVCLVPAESWAALSAYMLHLISVQNYPKSVFTNIALLAAVSVMDLEAKYLYASSIESDRLVMHYNDGVTDPRRDIEAMDRHVAHLEELTGRPLREKIHWVRGSLLGRGKMAAYGLALGSTRSPANWETADDPQRHSLDRHELAHAVVHQYQPPEANPPFLLIEGWAETQAGTTAQTRARWAKESRDLWRGRTGAGPTDSYLRYLTREDWYHRVDGPIYNVGGAFAQFLLNNYGIDRFFRLYFACRPGKFEDVCQEVLDIDLDTLDSQFWEWVERTAA